MKGCLWYYGYVNILLWAKLKEHKSTKKYTNSTVHFKKFLSSELKYTLAVNLRAPHIPELPL
jgi:hypothetical protein